ncbi:MAG TPA: hypothetical protein VGH27_11955, partial [Streptosporangiaceae bacterium]
RVFADGAPAYLQFRNNNLGSYPANAGYAPESQECRDCVLEDVSHALTWTGFAGVLAYWLACIAAAAWLIRTSVARSRRRGFAFSSLMLIGCTLVQYATSVYGEGNEVTKHLSVGLFTSSLAPVLLAAGALVDRRRGETGDASDADLAMAVQIPHQADKPVEPVEAPVPEAAGATEAAEGVETGEGGAASSSQPQWLQPLVQDEPS